MIGNLWWSTLAKCYVNINSSHQLKYAKHWLCCMASTSYPTVFSYLTRKSSESLFCRPLNTSNLNGAVKATL